MQKVKSRAKKLKLRRYPYTYVRATVMKSLLFRKEDYHKMLKMSFSEIAKFMQESNYKKEISELATEHSGADLLELALNRSLAASFKKLIRISPNELGLLIKEYTKRKDMEDIKTIVRGKFTNTDNKLILNSITGAGTLSLDFLTSLLEKDLIEEILKENKLINFSLLSAGLSELKEKKSLVGIENALDKFYYDHLIEFSKILPKEGALFRNFLLKEVQILNILTLLRLKKSKVENLKDFIIKAYGQTDSIITSLMEADDVEALLKVLENTQYRNAIDKGIEDLKSTGSLITLETELYKHLLKQSMLLLHQHPLSVDVILGYMFAKDIEIRNLRIIIKGKQLGLSEEFIEKQLVF